ncbi:MAG TPA: helix-turn-helix domain-containing protein [Acidimicrobiales bacterium]|nr:helix-turn-helix domain-containing protein [Acidimicrobiales bacterium]
MPSAKDTYSAAQAADIIGVSERRVRQLVAEKKLPGVRSADGTVRIPQQAVNEERKKRRGGSTATASTATKRKATGATKARSDVDVDALASAVASAVGQRLEGQLEVTRRAESLVRAELDEERARRMEAEAKLAEAQRQVEELREAASKRGIFKRRRPVASEA